MQRGRERWHAVPPVVVGDCALCRGNASRCEESELLGYCSLSNLLALGLAWLHSDGGGWGGGGSITVDLS